MELGGFTKRCCDERVLTHNLSQQRVIFLIFVETHSFQPQKHSDMKKRKGYKGEGLKFFMNYLPDEIFNSLNDEERYHYREYRRYQKFMGESKERVEKYKQEVEKLNQLIQKENQKVKGTKQESGWKDKMTIHYDKVSHLDKELKLNCSVEKRERTSQSKKIIDNRSKPSIGTIVRGKYGGKPLKKYYKLYGRVENVNQRKYFYFGDESEVRKLLSELYGEDFSKDDFDDVKDELKVLISQFSRYHIYHSNWDEFKSETHNLRGIIDWCKWCDENDVNRYDWGGTK